MTLSTLKAETLGIVLLLYFVDVPLKEESCAQIEQQSSFFYRKDKEVHHFVGQDILTEEALDSFAASTWPAVTALCQYLESHCKELDLVDKAVMEIGSGTGLVSIVAALLGAWVTATDFPDVLSNLRLNLSRNTRGKCRYTPQVAALSWSFDLERTYPTSVYHYDYVVAADVVYHYDLISKLLATMKHFCQSGTTILWANKVRADIDIEFEEIFKATFNTKLVFEDGETRIFMGTHKEKEEEQYVEEGSVNAEMLRDKPECELQMEDEKEKSEGTGVRRKKHITLRDESDSKELVDDKHDEGYEDNEKEGKNEDEDMNEKAVDGPDPDSKEDTTGQSSVTVEEATLRDNRDSKDEINVVDDEKDEEEEEEEEESRVVNEEAAVSPGPYTKDETSQSLLILYEIRNLYVKLEQDIWCLKDLRLITTS
uniref:Si:ch73-244f7.3 n=1 Tax=Neogobius melanostomus TaxID=47308 RepID=A0A8C6TPH0_9GOBI